MRFLPTATLLILMTTIAQAAPERFFIGTYTEDEGSRGIYTGTLDSETGTLSPLELAAEAKNPGYLALAPDGQTLYAASEDETAIVVAFSVGEGGKLTRLNDQPTGGKGACFVSVQPSGGHVFVANYGSGSIAAFPVDADGALGERSGFAEFEGSGPNEKRQKGPHAHSIYPVGDDRVVACDLGTDHVWRFRLVDGEFVPEPAATVKPGSGPRHLAMAADGSTAYVVGEMGLDVSTFAVDPATGEFTPRHTIPTHPQPVDGIKLAAIKLDPAGKFATVSSRGDDELIVYRLTGDAGLERVEAVPSVVEAPRDFSYDPSGRWLIAAGQDDDRLVVFEVDADSGKLTPTEESATLGKPVCVVFAGE